MEEIAIVRCLQNASGAISKMQVLQAFKDVENFRKILYYALNPMLGSRRTTFTNWSLTVLITKSEPRLLHSLQSVAKHGASARIR